jgi:hypothetical protein
VPTDSTTITTSGIPIAVQLSTQPGGLVVQPGGMVVRPSGLAVQPGGAQQGGAQQSGRVLYPGAVAAGQPNHVVMQGVSTVATCQMPASLSLTAAAAPREPNSTRSRRANTNDITRTGMLIRLASRLDLFFALDGIVV